MKPPSRWWWDLSTREFAELDLGRVVAVLPVGAIEQHGPHFPVRVDAAIDAGIVARAVELMPDDLPIEACHAAETVLELGALAHDLLGRRRVVPEGGVFGFGVEFG